MLVPLYTAGRAKARFGIDTIRHGMAGVIDELDWPKMDVFVMLAAVERLRDPLGVLRKVNTYLSHGGLLLLSTGVWVCFNHVVAGMAWSIIAREGHLYYFSKRTMRMFLERAGFRVLELETNSALVNTLTKSNFLVKLFNNRFTRRLRIPAMVQRLRLGDEMFVIARKSVDQRSP